MLQSRTNFVFDVYRVVIGVQNANVRRIAVLMAVPETIVDGYTEQRSMSRLPLSMKRTSQTNIRILLLVNAHPQLHYARSLSLFETETNQLELTRCWTMAVHEPT